MVKYAPMLSWTEQDRTMRAVCGLCDWHVADCTIAIARAHVLAHPTHIVATVATVTTLLHIKPAEIDVTETPLLGVRREAERVQG
jgi:hypothetical protein